MKAHYAYRKLIELQVSLPKSLTYKYICVEGQKELITTYARIIGIPLEESKKEFSKHHSSSTHNNLRDKKYDVNKYLANAGVHQKYHESKNKTIIALSTDPIIIDTLRIKDTATLYYIYLHEVGHLKDKDLWNRFYWNGEKVADNFAVKWLNKLKRDGLMDFTNKCWPKSLLPIPNKL